MVRARTAGRCRSPRRVCARGAAAPRICLAQRLLKRSGMATRNDPLEIPLLVILWTTLTVGLIMVMVVLLMK